MPRKKRETLLEEREWLTPYPVPHAEIPAEVRKQLPIVPLFFLTDSDHKALDKWQRQNNRSVSVLTKRVCVFSHADSATETMST